jgi:hypothetical protein
LVDLQTLCARYGLETWFPTNNDIQYVCSTYSIVELKTRFETWITRNEVNRVSLFDTSYVITLMAYLFSQKTPNYKSSTLFWLVDLLYICAKWELERCVFQIMLFANVCSTGCIDEIVTRFETWISRNDVNDLSLCHVSYLIRLMEYLFSQWSRNVQIKYFMFNWPV